MSSASDASFLLEIPDHDSDFLVLSFHATEEISATFEVNLTVSCDDDITFESLQLQKALFTITSNDNDRYFHGLIRKFRQSGRVGNTYIYQIQIVPALHFLYLKENCRIFQKQSIQKIVDTILEEHDISGDAVEWRLANDLPPRRFCVQYQESDLEFISRLLEEEGVFFFFEHFEDMHVLVFCDTEAFYQEIEGESILTFNSNDGMVAEKESVNTFAISERTRSGKFIHKNYNFETPSVDLATEDEGEELDELFSYEYHGLYGKTDRGKYLANVRLQEIHTLKKKGRGISNVSRLTPGATFTLSDHPCSAFNDSHLIVDVVHEGKQPQAIGEFASEEAASYCNVFMVIPSKVTYRPERITPKPIVPGIQTATVTGPSDEEIYVDKYGRVKVQFHWDNVGEQDDNTSCWLRVNQIWNGTTWGSQFIPRVGDEVLVAFINGDMDFPIILGSAINEAKQPNFDLPANKTQSGFKTKSHKGDGFHELRFDDANGSEEIFLHSQKDLNIQVQSRRGQTIGGDSGTVIGKNCDKQVGGDNFTIVKGKSTELAKEIVIAAYDKITIVSGASSIEITPGGIKINGPKVDINGGGGASMPAARPISGSTGKSSGGGGGKSDAGSSSPKPDDKKASKPETAKPVSKPEPDKPVDDWKAGPVVDRDVGEEAEEGVGGGWTEIPPGGWPNASKLPTGVMDEIPRVNGIPRQANLDALPDISTNAGDLVSSASSSIPAGLQNNIKNASSTLSNASALKDTALNKGQNALSQGLDSAKGNMLEKSGLSDVQSSMTKLSEKPASLLNNVKINPADVIKKF